LERIYQNITELIGNTPLLSLNAYCKHAGLPCELVAKLEKYNPAGSAKDRIALAMIEAAEAEGSLKPGATLIEPTSGNTGIGLACVAIAKGYSLILTMPETMSEERKALLRAYGAKLVLTEGKLGMKGAIAAAEELKSQMPNSFIPSQFTNPANPAVHRATTGPEIYQDTEGKLDCFVAGVGTGGTVSGVGEYLKSKNSRIYIAAVEPADSPVLSGGSPGPHALQGIGAGFVPEIYNASVIDEVLMATKQEAFEASRAVAQTEGLLIGISGGAAIAAATRLGRRPECEGWRIVVLLPDSGERYLSTPLFKREEA